MGSLIKLVVTSLAMFMSVSGYAGDIDYNRLIQYLQNKDYPPVEKFLDDNRKTLSSDPEYYVILLNYVMTKGSTPYAMMAKGKAENGDIEIKDNNTGEPVGFIRESISYDNELILDGVRRTRKALPSFRSRMDIQFGLAEITRQLQEWELLGEILSDLLTTSGQVDQKKWLWKNSEPMKNDAREFLIENILPHTAALFKADNPAADKALVTVSEKIIKTYPDKVYGYSNIATLYLAQKRYDESEKYFKMALKIDPKDEIVLGNLKRLEALRNQK